MSIAAIHNGFIVIAVPIEAIEAAVPYAAEKAWGGKMVRVTDADAFAKELVSELNKENEIGDTGAEGVE